MPLWAVPYGAATLVLGFAGAAKLARPGDTARALRSAGLPGSPQLVRAGAGLELAAAAAAWTVPAGRPALVAAAFVAGSYLALALFVAVALRRRWALSTCGCFARPDTPPRARHVVLDASSAAAAFGWAASAATRLGGVGDVLAAAGTTTAVALASTTAALALLAYLAFVEPAPAPAAT